MKLHPLLLGLLLFSVAQAQNATPPVVSVPPPGVPLRPVINADPVQLRPAQFEITAAWNEKTKDKLSVPLSNSGDTVLAVLGVQATRGIFIVDFPSKVKAKGEDKINFIYDAADDTDGDMEVIRVKTDQGIVVLNVHITRQAAVTFDKKELNWKTGAKADPQTVTIKIPNGQVSPKKLKVSGSGNKADLVKVDGQTYQVKVTPALTAKSTQFAVTVQFDQPLPGVAPVIRCVVGE